MFLEKTIFENLFFLGSNFENVFWMLEQPVNNKVCSSIQFLLRSFTKSGYKKTLLRFLGG